MTGYVCLLDRQGTDVDPRLLRSLAATLEVYGSMFSLAHQGAAGIVIAHRCAQKQTDRVFSCTRNPDSGVLAAVSGVMTAVEDISLGQDDIVRPGKGITAPQALTAFEQGGSGFLRRTAGSFVFMSADPSRVTVTIARDHLGSRKVYYYLDERWLIAASEPAAILRHPAVTKEVEPGSVARFLGFRFTHTRNSFFRGIKELPPAHSLCVEPENASINQYWRFTDRPEVRKQPPGEVKTNFVQQIGESVNQQFTGLQAKQVGVSLSGGLDSTIVAAMTPRSTPLYSWFFDETPDCDERDNIRALAEHLDRPVHWISGDGLYPLSEGFVDQFVHENSPYINAFAALKCQLYSVAREDGCERMLVGDAGDVLYGASDYWVRDMLLYGQTGAMKSLWRTFGKAMGGDSFSKLALRRLLPVRHVRETLYGSYPRWLTDTGRASLPEVSLSPILPRGARKYRFDPAVGTKHTEVMSEERRLFAQCNMELGNPFWHWPLLEEVLSLPAWWFYRDGRTKVLAREASRGQLPDVVRNSRRIGLLGSFFLKGIEANKGFIREMLFHKPSSDWQRYVSKDWLESYLSQTNSISFGHTILWRVICYELWHRRLFQ